MGDKFRIGIVGSGLIAAHCHLPQVLASPNAELVALVDPVLERASQLAADYAIKPALARSVTEVLGQLDGAIIAAPNHAHHPLCVECLEAGVSVLVEKPLAVSVGEGEEIAAAAERSGKTVAVGYCTRFCPPVIRLGKLLEQGYFGAVRRFVFQFGARGGWAPLSAYILDREKTGGGVLVVNGSHILNRLLAWFGYPSATEFWDDSEGGPEANCLARLRWHDTEGEVRLSTSTQLLGGMALDTERGLVLCQETPQATIMLRSTDHPELEMALVERKPYPRLPERNNFLLQVEDFIEACRTGRDPMVNVAEGIESLRLIEQLYACRQPLVPEPQTAEASQ